MEADSASGRDFAHHRGHRGTHLTCPHAFIDLCLPISYYDIINERLSGHDRIHGMKKLTVADYRALAEFRYQIREFFAFSDRAVQAAGLERGQYQLMLAIKGMPERLRPRIREVANRLHVQHHSAVELINRLEAGGYVRRERAEDDRREVLLALTPKGEKVLEELALHHHEELQEAAPRLVAALRRVMAGKEDGADKGARRTTTAAKALSSHVS
jgi:DNA-binding MarR family transcriptional regulator